MKLTQYEMILTLMVRNRRKKKWFFPRNFMEPGLGDLFVGYEASARLSELASKYPHLIESKKEGKYMTRRLRFENIPRLFDDLPYELVTALKREMGYYQPKN